MSSRSSKQRTGKDLTAPLARSERTQVVMKESTNIMRSTAILNQGLGQIKNFPRKEYARGVTSDTFVRLFKDLLKTAGKGQRKDLRGKLAATVLKEAVGSDPGMLP